MTLTLEGRTLTSSEEFQIVDAITANSQIDILCILDTDANRIAKCEKALTERLMELSSQTGQFYKRRPAERRCAGVGGQYRDYRRCLPRRTRHREGQCDCTGSVKWYGPCRSRWGQRRDRRIRYGSHTASYCRLLYQGRGKRKAARPGTYHCFSGRRQSGCPAN